MQTHLQKYKYNYKHNYKNKYAHTGTQNLVLIKTRGLAKHIFLGFNLFVVEEDESLQGNWVILTFPSK